jgi:RHS repeat-associated protein
VVDANGIDVAGTLSLKPHDVRCWGGTGGTYALETYTYDQIGNIKSKPGVGVYTYTASATGCVAGTPAIKPHAVRYAGSYSFTYDCNGNMISRADSTGTFTQQWDKENRLITVTGSATANFVYDGDGNRVKATLGPTTTVYIGNYYEQSGSLTTTYYYAGGTRIAMRQGSTVNYLLGDHLGSTSITANSSGGLFAELRYKPWGEERYTNGVTTPTRRQYTGQIKDAEIGLYFYNARYYSSALGRFLSADTLVPQASDPQSWNRFSYTRNNPVNRIDPSGHMDENEDDGGIGDPEIKKKIIRKAADKIQDSCSWISDRAGTCYWSSLSPSDQYILLSAGWEGQKAWDGEHTPEGGVHSVAGTEMDPAVWIAEFIVFRKIGQWLPEILGLVSPSNPVPTRVARVVGKDFVKGPYLSRPGAPDAFVTAAEDISSINNSVDLARRLTLVDKSGNLLPGPYAVHEFNTPFGIASPVFRNNPGFVGQGLTKGGVREFVIPNLLLEQLQDLITRIIP